MELERYKMKVCCVCCKYYLFIIIIILSLLNDAALENSICDRGTFPSWSVNCSAYYNGSYFMYSNQTTQNDAIELLDTLSKVTNGSYCTEMLNRFLCYLIFPPCDQSSNIQMINTESCQNYVVDGLCAIHVEAMIEVLQNNNMSEVADDLYNCNSPLLEPDNVSSSSIEISLPSLGNRSENTQCEMLPENACEGVPLNYDYYAIDIANRPQLINFAVILSELHEQYRDIPACTSFLGMTVCLAEFPPCSADNNRLQEICESGCSRYSSLLLECVTNIIETTGDIDFSEISQINEMFNCSNPETYLPGVSGSLYDTEENCHDLYDVDNGVLSDGSSSSSISQGLIAVIVSVSVVVAIIVVLLLVLGIILWKYKNRNNGPQVTKAKPSNFPHQLISKTLLGRWKQKSKNYVIDYELLRIESEVAKGEFGKVHSGWFKSGNTYIEVAIKETKDLSSSKAKEFMEECSIAKKFDHPNVLSLLGISFTPEENKPLMVMPYMHHGDVKSYLKSKRGGVVKIEEFPQGINYSMLVQMCLGIAKGMKYLSLQRFVHRDLAARNCMLDKNLLVKVADFGLSRDIYVQDYYKTQHDVPLPVKWLAPEALFDREFSTKTDVWAFGVTCWEIFALGQQPYPSIGAFEIKDYIKDGGVLDKPSLCSDQMYQIIRSCWNFSPDERPLFTTLVEDINKHSRESEVVSSQL